MVRSEGQGETPSASNRWRMAAAPHSPSTLRFSSRRAARTRRSTRDAVRRVRLGVSGRSDQSTRSSRRPLARVTQRWTVERLTPNSAATDRNEPPRRTAKTMARRCCGDRFLRHGRLRFFPSAWQPTTTVDKPRQKTHELGGLNGKTFPNPTFGGASAAARDPWYGSRGPLTPRTNVTT